MSSPVVQAWLRQNVALYAASDRVFADIDSALARFTALQPKADLYTFDDGRVQLLLCLHGLLPISYRGASYNIPLAVWVVREYPRQPPLVYVVPTSDMLVRPGRYLDVSGRCSHEYLRNWQRKDEGCNLTGLLEDLQDQFSREPPVYAKPPSTPPKPVPPPPGPPVPPRPPSLAPSRSPVSGHAANFQGPIGAQTVNHLPDSSYAQLSNHTPYTHPRALTHLGAPPHHPTPQPHPTPPPPVPPPPPPGVLGAPLSQIPVGVQGPASAVQFSPPAPGSELFRGGGGAPPPTSIVNPAVDPHPALVPNLLDADDDDTAPRSLQGQPATAGPPPPRRPPNPELLLLHQRVHAKLTSELHSLSKAFSLDAERLRATQRDLLHGEPAIKDECARLEAVRDVCLGVAERTRKAVVEAEGNVGELKRKGDPNVDEVVCATSIVHNQLLNLVAEDNAIEDTIYHLHRALNNGRIDLDRFLRTTRVLAEEQFMKRALINKIQAGLRLGGGSAAAAASSH